MIKFALACAAGHEFESWFSDGAAYDTQVKRGFVQCPVCGSKQVGKAIMAPRVVTRRAVPPPVPSIATPAPAAAEGSATPVALLDDKTRELRTMIRAVRERMMTDAEDVGGQFAAEARRIHDGDAAERPIYGQATLADARALLEDGIGVLPIPVLPDEQN